MLGYSERMSIHARTTILPLSIVLCYCLTKSSNLTFIGCHNVQLQSCSMVVTTSVRAPSWHGDIHMCTLTCFVRYPLHKFRLPTSFLLFVATAYFRPYILPCLIQRTISAYDLCISYPFPMSPRCRDIFSSHFPISPCCILSCLLLSPRWIQFFSLLSPCWTRFSLDFT